MVPLHSNKTVTKTLGNTWFVLLLLRSAFSTVSLGPSSSIGPGSYPEHLCKHEGAHAMEWQIPHMFLPGQANKIPSDP